MGRVTDGTLLLRWDKREYDFKVWYPCKPDGHLLFNRMCNRLFCPKCQCGSDISLVDELERRGYDTKTLRFTVKRRAALKAALEG